GELRSPKRYIIKAQVPKRDSASTDLSVRPTKNLGTEVRSLVGRFTMVGCEVRSHLHFITKRRSLVGRFTTVAWKVRSPAKTSC
ncbi:MAG: hypothetical protein ACOVVP_16840, partial [Pseudanabaena sp.]